MYARSVLKYFSHPLLGLMGCNRHVLIQLYQTSVRWTLDYARFSRLWGRLTLPSEIPSPYSKWGPTYSHWRTLSLSSLQSLYWYRSHTTSWPETGTYYQITYLHHKTFTFPLLHIRFQLTISHLSSITFVATSPLFWSETIFTSCPPPLQSY